MKQEPAFARNALGAGASGYVLKEAAGYELVEAVRRAAAGESYLAPSLGARMKSLRCCSYQSARWSHTANTSRRSCCCTAAPNLSATHGEHGLVTRKVNSTRSTSRAER